MKLIFGPFAAVCAAIALMLAVPNSAQAQSSRTWVSINGNDANTCTRTSPCQTFQGAITKTAVNGEINCLDAGDFNPVAIIKSVTIDCREAFNSINSANFSSGIAIQFENFNGSDSQRTVILRHLGISGTTAGFIGIAITGGSNVPGTTVIIEDCVIQGMRFGTGRGIDDARGGGGRLIVKNTTIQNNSGAAISVLPTSNSVNVQVLLDNVRGNASGTGAQFGNLVRAAIVQSTFDANLGAGILTVSGAIANIDRSTMSHNANGVQAAGGIITLANSNITLNTSQAVNVSGGSVVSFGNNRIAFNASPGTTPSAAGAASSDLGQQ